MGVGRSTTAREAAIKSFTDDPDCRVMLTCLGYAELAINLTAASYGLSLEKEATAKERCHRLESECSLYKQQLEASEEQYVILQKERDMLKAEKTSLLQAAIASKKHVDLLTSEKEELQKEMNIEKEKMREIKDEIKLFSLAFAQRECTLSNLYTKSGAL